MASRGTNPSILDNADNQAYQTVGPIGSNGEILVGKKGGAKNKPGRTEHDLPEVSHKSNIIYVKENPDGSFRELKVFGNDHKCTIEIDYTSEPNLDPSGKKVLHVHDINGKEFKQHPFARYPTKDELEKYKEYFVGINLKGVKTHD
jgi:hypothetical protein